MELVSETENRVAHFDIICVIALHRTQMIRKLASKPLIGFEMQATAPQRIARIIEVCASEVCVAEVCASEVCASEVCTSEVGSSAEMFFSILHKFSGS